MILLQGTARSSCLFFIGAFKPRRVARWYRRSATRAWGAGLISIDTSFI